MNILVAADRHWAIGKDGRGLVTIPADQQMLMRETAGKVLLLLMPTTRILLKSTDTFPCRKFRPKCRKTCV